MKKSDLRQLIREEVRKTSNEVTKIISKEFGGNDDSEFLKIIWKMPVEDLEILLRTTLSNLTYFKNTAPKGKIMGLFAKKDIELMKFRIKLIKEVLSYKKKDPSFIPDIYK